MKDNIQFIIPFKDLGKIMDGKRLYREFPLKDIVFGENRYSISRTDFENVGLPMFERLVTDEGMEYLAKKINDMIKPGFTSLINSRKDWRKVLDDDEIEDCIWEIYENTLITMKVPYYADIMPIDFKVGDRAFCILENKFKTVAKIDAVSEIITTDDGEEYPCTEIIGENHPVFKDDAEPTGYYY